MERVGGTEAPLTGCSNVKRGGNPLASKLPIIPYSAGAQASFRDQLHSMDGPGLRLLLDENRPENRPEPKHKIFLSHSGAQKSFVKQLCKDIERYDRYPFFDVHRTSLPIGCHFPNAIFEAIGQCQVGVVILSEDFFSRTKWPMLELSALVKRKSDDPHLVIMPVFLGLTREQCRERENQDRWCSLWQGWAKEDKRIVLEDWKAVFKVFGYINSVSLRGLDEVTCREEIVDAVCKEVPSETRRDDAHVQGRSRMCKTIDEEIKSMESSELYKVKILGLYGVGGIGKSTACMTLCNYYSEEFHGRVCHVEFGDMDELLMLQEILRRLTDTNVEQIDRLNKDECKHRMKDIKNQKIFLAMDNVFDSHEIVERAKLILRAGFAKSSIVIVAARSLGELQNLNLEESKCMKMLELTLDDATSLFVREVACDASASGDLIQQCVSRCYFREGDGSSCHYHPLALRVLGGQLGSDPRKWLEKLEEIDVFNQYQERANKNPIFSILRRSFDILKDEDKLLFMDIALFGNLSLCYVACKYDIYEWLSMLHGKSIKSGLSSLKRKSLIQILEEKNMRIGIHDLWREFCIWETRNGELKSRRWIYEDLSHSNDSKFGELTFYSGVWKRVERMLMRGTHKGTSNVSLNLSRCSNLVVLNLEYINMEGKVLDLSGAFNLKSLQMRSYSFFKVHGLGLLKNLFILEWSGRLPTNMEFIEEIGGSTNLQILTLNHHGRLFSKIPNLSNLSLLKCLVLGSFLEGNFITCTAAMTNLQYLCLKRCESLQRCNGVGNLVALKELQIIGCHKLEELPNFGGGNLVALKELQIIGCHKLEELPNFGGLKNLKKLEISRCNSIQALLGVGDLVTLLELRICGCINLGKLPDLSKLTNLQVLVLRECSLKRAVVELGVLVGLQKCWISAIGLGEINDLQRLTKLQSITIEGWNPQASASVDSLVNLEHLVICNCKGVDIFDGLLRVSRICRIELSNCEFKDVACLGNFLGLRKVSFDSCSFLERFPDMHKVTRLETLDISGCQKLRVCEGLRRTRTLPSKAIGVHLESGGTFPNLRHLSLRNLVAVTELPDLSIFQQLINLLIIGCQNLVRLTSSVPLSLLRSFVIIDCESLITIPNLSCCKNLAMVQLSRVGVKLSGHEIENLKTMCPGIVIN